MKLLKHTLTYVLTFLLVVATASAQNISRGVTTWHADENFVTDVQNQLTNILNILNSPKPVGLTFDFIGIPPTSTSLRFVAPTLINFPANLGSGTIAWASLCNAKTASTADTVFSITKNGVQIATATVPSGTKTCTFSTQAAFTLSAGDTLSVVSPASPDATLANIAFTLGASR
jgi:hypothetical protein